MSLINKRKKTIPIPKRWKITNKCLNLILECAKSEYPHEFGGFLRVDSKKRDTIYEILILPGTISGESHAMFRMSMLPIDFTIVGTVHSHPSYSPIASETDRQLFQKYGKVHIIIANPFNEYSWKSYNNKGEEIKITIV